MPTPMDQTTTNQSSNFSLPHKCGRVQRERHPYLAKQTGLDKKKADALAEHEAKETRDEKKRREKTLKESKKIVLEEDGMLPKPTKVCSYVVHWVMGAYLRDDSKIGYLTCEMLTVALEPSVEVVCTLRILPEGKTAPGGHELIVNYWRVGGPAPGAEDAFTECLVQTQVEGGAPIHLLRHLQMNNLTVPFIAERDSCGRSCEHHSRQSRFGFSPLTT